MNIVGIPQTRISAHKLTSFRVNPQSEGACWAPGSEQPALLGLRAFPPTILTIGPLGA